MTLTWDDPNDDSIIGCVILRRDKDLQPEEGTFFTVVSDTGSAETTYIDNTVEPDKRYVYRIKAINAHGLSEISSWVRAYAGSPVAGIEDCDAEGSICTGDGRMLSNELVLTVSGPGDRPVQGCRPALYGR